ncbi:FAD-dependent oxidoreductase [Sphingobacterium sp.]|uniref:FAD-dependent oxidoreductase n=1 Tax=Sphingobacterium sp. TaxID=341027 RepID=UPI0025DB37B6|nr:FAD-dependent oxidoreductase [Sphingobacterium sp.]
MITSNTQEKRNLKHIQYDSDLVVTGGGMSGICTAITAARQGLNVILIQDRPILGGNASSEVRLWMLGATSHMGNNNRWSREGGVIDEILVENTYRNPQGNPIILDMILMDKVNQEKNIRLFLNTAVYHVEKSAADQIESIRAFCSQNSTLYTFHSPLFCDASGDGIVGFLAGAAFRMGAEGKEEFGEGMAPSKEYGELLGHSLYFYTKDTGIPVSFIPPAFALKEISQIPRFKQFKANEHGCKLWWVEYGGRLDTIHDTETIKWELWKIIYGVWNYIKNSGNFPESETLTLEWVGMIPGKRESRRFEGDYMMIQQDLVEQRQHPDAVAYGGWSIDLHPADGVYSELPGCNQWHSKGIFDIPYRTLFSKNIRNLFLTGRLISVSHVAFGATRVMATCAYVGQAVGMAAALCKELQVLPRQLTLNNNMHQLQQRLMAEGQHIPSLALYEEHDLALQAQISTSSELPFTGFGDVSLWKPLTIPSAQLLPMKQGKLPVFQLAVQVLQDTVLETSIRISEKAGNFTPDITLATRTIHLTKGTTSIDIDFDTLLASDGYVFLTFQSNPDIQLGYTEKRVTGVMSVFNSFNKAVSNNGKQIPITGVGVDEFEFWCPQRRPDGQNIAVTFKQQIDTFTSKQLKNGVNRPVTTANAWVAHPKDETPTVVLDWDTPKEIARIDLWFDTDFDHAMESVLMSHPENIMPFCVRAYTIKDSSGKIIYSTSDNFRTLNRITFTEPIRTERLSIQMMHPSDHVPASLFDIRCFEKNK